MGILVNTGFDVGSSNPIDSRTVKNTTDERDALVTNGYVYEGMEVYCKDTKVKYRWNGTEWEEVRSGSGTASDVAYDNTALDDVDNVAGALDTLVSEVNELFQSVSNGKQLIASAITDKGVETLATDTFETIAENISNIAAGDLSAIYSALNSHGFGISGKEDEEKIAKIIQDLLVLAYLSQDTGIVEDFTDSIDNTIHEDAFIESTIGKIPIEPKELLFVDNADYIEFEEITKSEYTTRVLLNRG